MRLLIRQLPASCFASPKDRDLFHPDSIIDFDLSWLDAFLKLRLSLFGSSEPSPSILRIGSQHNNYYNRSFMLHLDVTICGSRMSIGDGVFGKIKVVDRGSSRLHISDDCSFQSTTLELGRKNSCFIGKDCMFSRDTTCFLGDHRPIFNISSKEIVNLRQSTINMGVHVWVGMGARVFSSKELEIGSGSIIGMNALVTSSLPGACIAVGSPARPVKNGYSWSRLDPPRETLENHLGPRENGRVIAGQYWGDGQ